LALAVDNLGREPACRGRPALSRRTIIDRAHAWIAAHTDLLVQVTALARATGVSVRTLRNAFLDCYGVGPQSYLAMRQLHQVRAALIAAEQHKDTVTGVAMQCGVWDVEVMATRYKRLFGESPSHTLRLKNAGTRRQMVATAAKR
jgi:AraC family transcriptional regulator, ethanolamine operon transcriptional activator